MYPTLGDLLGVPLPLPLHEFFVALGVGVAAFVLWVQVRHHEVRDDRLFYVVTGAVVGGAVLMRMGTWLQHADLCENAGLVEQWLYGNRSILGGLVGAWLGVHLAKRLTGYRSRTGHLFAPAVAAGMAVGRVGCALTELPGTPSSLGFGPVLDAATAERLGGVAGVPLHPSFLYEIVFHAIAFAVLWWWLRDRLHHPEETFVLYVASYAVFRLLVELVRGNEVVWHVGSLGLTRPQIFLAATVPLVLLRVWWLWRHGRLEPAPRHTPSETQEVPA